MAKSDGRFGGWFGHAGVENGRFRRGEAAAARIQIGLPLVYSARAMVGFRRYGWGNGMNNCKKDQDI